MPSYAIFTDTERLIDEMGKQQVACNHENSVFDTRRLAGRWFSDPVVQSDI